MQLNTDGPDKTPHLFRWRDSADRLAMILSTTVRPFSSHALAIQM